MTATAPPPQVGIKPDVITFTTAISACGSCGLSEEALSIYREMERAGVRPNIITHNAVMSACIAAGQWEEALDFFTEVVGGDGSGAATGGGGGGPARDPTEVADACSYNTALSACEVRRRRWSSSRRRRRLD